MKTVVTLVPVLNELSQIYTEKLAILGIAPFYLFVFVVTLKNNQLQCYDLSPATAPQRNGTFTLHFHRILRYFYFT